MTSSRRFSSLITAAIVLIAAFSALAQSPRQDFNRPQTFDAQHYTIRASFDRAKKRVSGETTIVLKPLKDGFRSFELDAVDMSFESIKLQPADTPLQYQNAGGKVVVMLDRAYGVQETVTVALKYTASPKKGVYFVSAEGSAERGHSAQIWTQGEPDEARHWFPSFDFPSDKATTEQYLTVEKGETVIGNGELVDKVENTDGTETWHYKMPVPHSTYLVSFVIGKYSKVEDTYKDIPLGFYIYPGRENTAKNAFGNTKDMMRVFEELTGIAFPYNKYDQTLVAKFQFGGMENITATTMSDNDIFLVDSDYGKSVVTDLVSHELAHSWFGNMVTCRNWAELWLNEGFASYMEAAYLERLYGRDNYIAKIRADAADFLITDTIGGRRHGLFNLKAGDVGSLFDSPAVTYDKGSAIVHTLREQVGTEVFWKGINLYLNRHKFASVESTDLRRAMEEASGQELGWFFDQWVYGTGAPALDIKPVYSARSKTLTITLSQTQSGDATTRTAFRLPMELVVKTSAGTEKHRVEITKRVQTVSFRTQGVPVELIADEMEQIPVKRVKMRKIATSK